MENITIITLSSKKSNKLDTLIGQLREKFGAQCQLDEEIHHEQVGHQNPKKYFRAQLRISGPRISDVQQSIDSMRVPKGIEVSMNLG